MSEEYDNALKELKSSYMHLGYLNAMAEIKQWCKNHPNEVNSENMIAHIEKCIEYS